MSSIFTKIIQRDIPAYIVAEDMEFIAFLDVNPNAKGHTLCVPKKEVDKLFDLDAETYTRLMQFSQKVAHALEKAISCKRIGLAVVGLEVPHVHVHLIPLQNMSDFTFSKKEKLSSEEFESIAEKIRKTYNGTAS